MIGAACDQWIGDESRVCGVTEGVREYLPGRRCPAHTPAALAGHPEPGQTATPIVRRMPTPLSAQGGTDVNKSRRGGYTSRQAAQRRAEVWAATHPDA